MQEIMLVVTLISFALITIWMTRTLAGVVNVLMFGVK